MNCAEALSCNGRPCEIEVSGLSVGVDEFVWREIPIAPDCRSLGVVMPLDRFRALDFLAPLAIRLYMVPIFWMAGSHKIDLSTLMPYQSTVDWFGNPDWGLGLPAPELLAYMAAYTEAIGALLLLLGLQVVVKLLPTRDGRFLARLRTEEPGDTERAAILARLVEEELLVQRGVELGMTESDTDAGSDLAGSRILDSSGPRRKI